MDMFKEPKTQKIMTSPSTTINIDHKNESLWKKQNDVHLVESGRCYVP